LKWRRTCNELKGIEIDGLWCEEPQIVKIEAKRYFENRFAANPRQWLNLDSINFPSLSAEESDRKCRHIT